MVAVVASGALRVDLDGLESLLERVNGVRQRLDEHAGVDTLGGAELGHPQVAAVMQEFLDRMSQESARASSRVDALTTATREAVAGYRQVDQSFISATSEGGSR